MGMAENSHDMEEGTLEVGMGKFLKILILKLNVHKHEK